MARPVAAILLVVFTSAQARAQGAPRGVLIIAPDRALYHEPVKALAEELERFGIAFELVRTSADEPAEDPALCARLRHESSPVIVAAGSQLVRLAQELRPAGIVVHFMVPNVLDAPFACAAGDSVRLAGVACDVDPAVLVAWIAATRPGTQRVAVPYSDGTRKTVQALVEAGRARGVELVPVTAQADRFTDLTRDLERRGVDGVVMIPDAAVYNAPNVEHLLLWGVRKKCAVWAFSEKLVRAGALAGIYVELAEVGRRTAELVRDVLATGRTPQPPLVYPARVGKAINEHTAKLVGADVSGVRGQEGVKRFPESGGRR